MGFGFLAAVCRVVSVPCFRPRLIDADQGCRS
jgi:hypothetical protein